MPEAICVACQQPTETPRRARGEVVCADYPHCVPGAGGVGDAE